VEIDSANSALPLIESFRIKPIKASISSEFKYKAYMAIVEAMFCYRFKYLGAICA